MKKSLIAVSLLLLAATVINADNTASNDQNTILYKKGDSLNSQDSKYYQPIQARESGLSSNPSSKESHQANELISAAAGDQQVDKDIVKNSSSRYPEVNPLTETVKTQPSEAIQPIQARESGLSTPENAEDSPSAQANDLISAGAGNQPIDKEIVKNPEKLYPKATNTKPATTDYVQPIQANESGLSTPKNAEDSPSAQANDLISTGAGDQSIDKDMVKTAGEK